MSRTKKKSKEYKLPAEFMKFIVGEEEKHEEYFHAPQTRRIRELIAEVFRAKVEYKHRSSVKEQRYDSPSWALYQADQVGYERAFMDLLKLIEE